MTVEASAARRAANLVVVTILVAAMPACTPAEAPVTAPIPLSASEIVPSAVPQPSTTSRPPTRQPTRSPAGGSDLDAQSTDGAEPAAPAPTQLAEPTVADIAEDLGLDGLIAVIERDPDAAGDKGESLLKELRRVAERPHQSRIDRAIERTTEWIADGEVDDQVGQAALIVLVQVVDNTTEDERES